MNQAKLIKYYEAQLAKVIARYGDSPLHAEYVEKAKENLEAVKAGRTW